MVVASPYLARLTVSAPDRLDRRWWRGHPVSRRRTLITVGVAVVVGVAVGAASGWSALLPAYLWLALVAVPLAIVDIEVHRLPDRLILAGAVGACLLLLLAAAMDGRWAALLRSVQAAAVVLAVGCGLTAVGPYGFGDAKLGALLAAYLGWTGWLAVFYGISAGFVVGALASLVLVVSGRATMRSPVPFGPALIAGALLVAALP